MDLGIKGKRALIGGGTSGIGFALAKLLVAEGAQVTLMGRSPEKGIAAIKQLGKGAEASFLACDLASRSAIADQVGSYVRTHPVDILVNNTGGPAAGDPLSIPLEAWEHGYQSLIESVLSLTRLVVPHMTQSHWGRILTITSTSSRELIPNLPVSSTFRAALRALTKELALAHGKDGILINNVLPGLTRTDRLKDLEHESPEMMRTRAQQIAVRRLAEPEEIARPAVFLLSNANTYVTGSELLVDGGLTRAI